MTFSFFCGKIQLTSEKGGVFMTEKERQDTKMATLFELRLFLLNEKKKDYTLEELLDLIDKIAMIKDQG